jgi:hypothetical protein
MKWKGKINFELRPQLNGSNLLLTEGAGEINAVTEKTAPVSADIVLIEDSAASYAKKKAQLSNLRKLNVQDEGSNVTNTPHTTLNFTGVGVTASDAGSGVSTVNIPGPIIQIVRKNITTVAQTTTTILEANTPTSTSGNAFDSNSITLLRSTSVVRVRLIIGVSTNNNAAQPTALLHRSTTVLAVGRVSVQNASSGMLCMEYYDTPGSVGPHTYSIRIGTQANTSSFNRSNGDSTPFGGTLWTNSAWLILEEIAV